MNNYKQFSDMPELAQAWLTFQHYAPVRPIRSEEDLERVHALAMMLADTVGDDENHPLYSLFDLALTLIGQWEKQHVSLPEVHPREVLRYMLEEHNLKQKDLADIASPALISDILAGRREISKRLAKSLAQRFHLDVSAFV